MAADARLQTDALPIKIRIAVNVYMPKDRVTGEHQSYGFVEFRAEEDADYAVKILNMTKLFGKPIRVNKSSQDKFSYDVGANLFIGNLDPDVDEKVLGVGGRWGERAGRGGWTEWTACGVVTSRLQMGTGAAHRPVFRA